MPLTLTRRTSETILIGDAVQIEVVESYAGRCKLRIIAPDDVVILRGELQLRPRQEVAAKD